MTISSIRVCPPGYRLLSAGQIDRIHTATLQLLETVGVSIRHQGARDMLAGAGCRVRNDKTVLIPAQLVADAIQSAPSAVVIYNRLGEKALHLEGRRIHFGPGTDLARVCDLDTGRLRTSTLKDVQAAVRIADALPEIDFIASCVIPNESPPHLLYLDAIGRVGAGGSFLSTRQTARMLRSEHWYPNLCNRDSVGAWQKNGSQDMAARAVEKARDILRIPPETALDASLQKEPDDMRCRAEKSSPMSSSCGYGNQI